MRVLLGPMHVIPRPVEPNFISLCEKALQEDVRQNRRLKLNQMKHFFRLHSHLNLKSLLLLGMNWGQHNQVRNRKPKKKRCTPHSFSSVLALRGSGSSWKQIWLLSALYKYSWNHFSSNCCGLITDIDCIKTDSGTAPLKWSQSE